jgi:hypothetical protein
MSEFTEGLSREEYLLMKALEESAQMHQTSVTELNCNRVFTDNTSKDGTTLLQLPIFNQFHARWNDLIGQFNTCSAICGYTSLACALLIAELDPSSMTKAELQSALCDLKSIEPKVADAMRYIQECRERYITEHLETFTETEAKCYKKAWVANYEISDYLRFACPEELQQRIAFVRFNQFNDLVYATHEERERIIRVESSFDPSEHPILVETFDKEKLQAEAQVHSRSDYKVLPSSVAGKLRAVLCDVSGHFAVVASCSDGKALFNTTDASYVSYPGRDAVGLAYSILR